MFCSKCGNKSPAGAQFCHKCGTKIVSVEVLSAESYVQPITPAPQSTDIAGPPALQVAPPDADAEQKPQPTGKPNFAGYVIAPVTPNTNMPKLVSYSEEYPVAPPPPAPSTAEPASPDTDFMDYEFYPTQSVTAKPAEEQATDYTDYTYYPMPPAVPEPQEPLTQPLPSNEADLTDYPIQPADHINQMPDTEYTMQPAVPRPPEPFMQHPDDPVMPEYLTQPIPTGPFTQMPNNMAMPVYSAQPVISRPIKPIPQYPNNPVIPGYPPQSSSPIPAEPMPQAYTFIDSSGFSQEPVTPRPFDPRQQFTENTDFVDYYTQTVSPETAMPWPQYAPPRPSMPPTQRAAMPEHAFPDMVDYLSEPAKPSTLVPWFADNSDYQSAKPAGQWQWHSNNAEYPTPPAAPKYETAPKYPNYPESSKPAEPLYIEHLPRKKSRMTIILSVIAFIFLAVVAIIVLSGRDRFNSNTSLAGAWEEVLLMGTWAQRYEFNEDGTGSSYRFNAHHDTVSNYVSFNWEFEGRNAINFTNYAGGHEMAEFSFTVRSGRTVLRLRFDNNDDWEDFWQIDSVNIY